MPRKFNAIIFAAPPPPLGGIASIVAILQRGMPNNTKVTFVSPIVKGERSPFIRSLLNLKLLLCAIFNLKKSGRMLFFSSAWGSFFEKIAWGLVVALLGGRPVIVLVAGDFPEFWSKCPPIVRKAIARILKSANFVLGAQSESWLIYYKSILPSVEVKVVGATVSAEFFDYVRPIKPLQGKIKVLYVGWIITDKGITDLLDAVSILHQTRCDVNLRLVGPAFGKESYWDTEVEKRGISAQVDFAGAISDRNDLIREFDEASIFVFPSYFEGFPVALLEAITMGLACIGTRVGGVPDILDNGNAGILISPKQPYELAKALKSLLDDADLVRDLSVKAARRAREIYNPSECIESYRKLIGV
jgi:glycosyltransferase involved in cell wall biosynthesis